MASFNASEFMVPVIRPDVCEKGQSVHASAAAERPAANAIVRWLEIDRQGRAAV
jgi:hypothetical protein